MSDPLHKFFELTVADVMSKNVITVERYQTMDEIAKVFTTNNISGAPVVDEVGKCVGVISSNDFISYERQLAESQGSMSHGMTFDMTDDETPGGLHVVENPIDKVYRHMSTAVQSVSEHDKLYDVAKIMCLEHIHRLIVLDSRSRPKGIFTALDLVATLWNLKIFTELQANDS